MNPLRRIKRTSDTVTQGFTLVELLTVIAIMLLMVAIAVPSLRRMHMEAHRAKCAANMRQIGIAVTQYATEHGGRLPQTRHTAEQEESWIFTLAPFLGDVDEVRISPADPQAAERLRRGATSYILNDLVVDPLLDPFGEPLPGGYGRLSLIPEPANTLLAVVISDNRGVGPANDHTHTRTWTSFNRFLSDVEPDRHRVGGRHPTRTQGSAPYLHVDGSVRIHDAARIQELLDSGRNIGEVGLAP